MSNIYSITGTDGKVAVHDPDRLWTWWNMKEIYTGGPGENRYAPRVGDYIEDTTGPRSITYEVTGLDLTTLIATWVKKRRECECGDENTLDGLVGPTSDSYRVYLDDSVTPHVLAVDARLRVGGTMTSHAKLFKGSNIGPDGVCISYLYDNSGTFLSQRIPLELVGVDIDTHVNHSIKCISVCNTNTKLRDGERVTAVIYDDNGHVVAVRELLAVNTSYVRSTNAAQKYIQSISLKSPYISSGDDHTLNYPINTPIDSANMIGRIHYSDGSIVEQPVDGTKFELMGLENFISTVIGQRFPVSLKYTLSPGEITYQAVSGEGKYITEPYSMITTEQIGSFTVKLYAYPVWIDSTTGYALKYFLYNLDRNIGRDVTGFVHPNQDSDVYNGKAYGLTQRLSVRINLRDADPSVNSYIHTQIIEVALLEPGTARTTNWSIGFEPSQNPKYGINVRARVAMVTASNYRVRVNSEATSLTDWLERLFYRAKPLVNLQKEVMAPEPNFFAIIQNGSRYEFPVTLWNSELTIGQSFDLNSTLFIEFIKRTPTNDIIMGVAGLPIYEM